MDRRTLLAGVGTVGLSGLAGCVGDVTEHEASAYGVGQTVAADAGYEQSSIDAIVIEEPVGYGPFTETVVATNYAVEYEKTVEIPILGERRAGVFSTFATPQVSVFGRDFNPVADMGTDELVELVQDNYARISNVEHDEDDEIAVLGETVPRSRFEASATIEGTTLEVDVDVHVTEAVPVGGDLVVTIGVYPTALRDWEERHMLAMMAGVNPEGIGTAAGDDGTEADGQGTDDDSAENGESDDGEENDDGVASDIDPSKPSVSDRPDTSANHPVSR